METDQVSDCVRPLISPILVHPESVLEVVERRRMSSVSTKTFCPTFIRFDVIDLFESTDGPLVVHNVCDESNAQTNALSDPAGARVRIISIPGIGTTSPLCISFDLMCQILVHYRVERQFRDILYCFGRRPQSGEGGCSNVFSNCTKDVPLALGYELQYAEECHSREDVPWSLRHTGIYHQASMVADAPPGSRPPFDLFILIHSAHDTVFRENVHSIIRDDKGGKDLRHRLCKDPRYLHEMALDSHLPNWRWYARFCGDKYTEQRKTIFAVEDPLKSPDVVGFEPVQRLRKVMDDVLFAKSFCEGNLDVVNLLSELWEKGEPHLFAITMRQKVKGYLHSFNSLQQRIENSLALLEYSLNLKNEATNAQTNKLMLDLGEHTLDVGENTHKLTQKTADDSVSVRVITYVSLVFLPGTFVSGVYGMNFFLFDTDNRSFIITPMFWIYIVTWLPLTIVTLMLYWLVSRYTKSKRQDSSENASTSGRQSSTQTRIGCRDRCRTFLSLVFEAKLSHQPDLEKGKSAGS